MNDKLAIAASAAKWKIVLIGVAALLLRPAYCPADTAKASDTQSGAKSGAAKDTWSTPPDKIPPDKTPSDKTPPKSKTTGSTAAADTTIPADVTEAIKELATEFEAVVKDPSAASRSTSDYFTAKPTTLSQEGLISLLKKRLVPDPRVDAYVKWQLLSAAPPQFDPSRSSAALSAYQQSPRPAARPGTDKREQAEVEKTLSKLKGADIDGANQQWVSFMASKMRPIEPTLNYRTELYKRIATSPDKLAAGFNDAMERMNAGHPSKDFVKVLFDDVRSFAGGRSQKELSQIGGFVSQWSGKQGAKTIEQITTTDKGAAKIKYTTPGFSKKEIDTLLNDLSLIGQAGGFK